MSRKSASIKEPRVVRKHFPKGRITRTNYRKRALPSLLADFDHRCAYSMLHEDNAGGRMAMDVDHFDPTIKDKYVQPYENLFLASRHCNGKKQDHWPNREMRSQGIRFLDCTSERDYGVHIFEDPITHRVFGVTPAGIYHVRVLDLNADVFVKHRTLRATLSMVMSHTPEGIRFQPIIKMSEELLKTAIPAIPYAVPPVVLAI